MFKNRLCYALIFVLFFSFPSYAIEKWSGLTKKSHSKMKYFLHTGFYFETTLVTSIYSFNLLSPVIAETEFDIVYLDKVMIPKKTKFIGFADVVKSGDRVNIGFTKMVFPDGSELDFKGLALKTDGSAGIPGKAKKHKAKIPAMILLQSATTLAAPTVGGEVIKSLSEEGTREMQQQQVSYSVTVKKGKAILIYNSERIEY